MLERQLLASAPQLSEATAARMVRAYGTDAFRIVQAGLGEDLGHGLHAGEVRWMRTQEWAQTADDILWRRSKLGLRFSPEERGGLERHIAQTLEEGRIVGGAV